MKALVKKEARKDIWMEDVAVPVVGVNDVLMKIKNGWIKKYTKIYLLVDEVLDMCSVAKLMKMMKCHLNY